MYEKVDNSLNRISSAASWCQSAITQYRRQRTKDTESCKRLFSSLFVGAALEVLRCRTKEQGLKQRMQFALNRSWIEKQLADMGVDDDILLSGLHESELKEEYQKLFLQIKSIIEKGDIFSPKENENLFGKNLESEAHDLLKQSVRNTRTQNGMERFDAWLNEKEAETILKNTGIDEQFKLKRVKKGYYIPQFIRFSNEKKIPTRPNVHVSTGFCAMSDVDWLLQFVDCLGEMPLLLCAPSGMGKSAFLCYLYDCIKNYRGKNCPFGGVFLLSLEGIKQTASDVHDYNSNPIEDPDRSLILNKISSRSGNGNLSRQWKDALEHGVGLKTDKPILLLLDGLNEICENLPGERSDYAALYNYILGEIGRLSQFKYVRIIVSTKIEAKGEDKEKEQIEAQVNTLAPFVKVNTATLEGISLASVRARIQELGLEIETDSELEKMLCRPMYYNHMGVIKSRKNIKTRYDMLREMYGVQFEQSCTNTAFDGEKILRDFLYRYYLPVFAYCYKSGHETLKEAHERCDKLLQNDLSFNMIGNTWNDVKNRSQALQNLLINQEQIITFIGEKKTISFVHQDYCDYLAAEYFLQRFSYIKEHLSDPALENGWGNQMDTLRLNTYSFDVLRLIYDALHFSTEYVDYFTGVKLSPGKMTWECLVWYTTAYQLSDLARLTGVVYNGKRSLGQDTLHTLAPFLEYAKGEIRNYDGKTTFSYLKPSWPMLQNVVEILMKACELNRDSGSYEEALSITKAAGYICNAVRKQGNQKVADLMQSVVDYNTARVYFHEFMHTNVQDELEWSLEALYKGTSPRNNPYRFSCNALAMMLVSPQPKLKDTGQYRRFKDTHFKDGSEMRAAFWMYFTAIYDVRKEGESWLPRLYSVRQLLFLLAENKVQIVPHGNFNPDTNDLKSIVWEYCTRKDFDKFLIYTPETDPTPIPTMYNLLLIQNFLGLIWHMECPWKHYLMGLVKLYLERSVKGAQEEFCIAYHNDSKDIRAKLWHAYLKKDQKRIDSIYVDGWTSISSTSEAENAEINGYNAREYFTRDIKTIYCVLKKNLAENKEFPLSLSSPPPRENFSQFLADSFCDSSTRDLRLWLSEIELVRRRYPEAEIVSLEPCSLGFQWVRMSLPSGLELGHIGETIKIDR